MGKFLSVLKFLFLRKWVIIPVIFALACYSIASFMTVYIGPAQFGISQVNYGGHRGLRDTPLLTGIHLRIPGYEQIHVFPTNLQSLDMTAVSTEEGKESRVVRPILIQTSDGYSVTLDVTVLYRIINPYLVLTKVGPGKQYEDSVVIPRSDSALRRALGELNSEEFYQASKRIQKTQMAFKELEAEFSVQGLELTKILIRKIVYDAAYQTQIEQRKIQDQTVLKNQAEGAAAKEEAHRREILSIGQATVQVELEKGRREVAQILADANLYRRNKLADANLLVQLAKAQGTSLENRALEGAGAAGIVGLKMAETLKGIKVIVVPSSGPDGANPLDIGTLIKQFGAQR